MRCFPFAAAAMTIVLGCASAPPQAVHGYFLDGAPLAATPALGQSMASDAAKKLTALYPPAHARLQLLHPMQDDFGAALTAALRTAGYAIVEQAAGAEAKASGSPAAESAGQSVAITLAYIVDQQPELGLWRLTLLVSGQPLSRLYRIDTGAAAPAGYWIRKE